MKNNFDEIFERIRRETGIRTLTQLAKAVGRSQPSISEGKKNGKFQYSWAVAITAKYGLITEWIMTGEGAKRPEETQRRIGFFADLETWAREVSGTGNLEWLENQIEAQFPAFKKWREEKTAVSIQTDQVKVA